MINSMALLTYLLYRVFTGKFLHSLSMLINLLMNCILTLFVKVVSFDKLSNLSVITLPGLLPFAPRFGINTVLSIVTICLISTARAVNSASTLYGDTLGHSPGAGRVNTTIYYSNFIDSMSNLFKYAPVASFDRGMNLTTVSKIIGHFAVTLNTVVVVVNNIFPTVKCILAAVPRTMLNKYAVVVFNDVLFTNFNVVTHANFSRHGVIVIDLSLDINLNFASTANVFGVFPRVIHAIFTSGYITMIFLLTIVLGLMLPGGLSGTWSCYPPDLSGGIVVSSGILGSSLPCSVIMPVGPSRKQKSVGWSP